MTVIDLGELGHGTEPVPEPRRPRAPGRPLRVVLAGLLALLTPVAAAPPPDRPALLFGRAQPEPGWTVTDDLLVVVESPGGGSLPTRQLVALGLPDGRTRWTWSLPAGEQLVGLDTVGGDVVVSVEPGDGPAAVLLDPTDGRVRWRQPGAAVPTGDGGLLLETVDPGQVTVRGVDPVAGTVRWTATTGPGTVGYRTAGRVIEAVVVVTRSGRVEVRDPHTGVARTTFRVPPARGESYELAQVAGDLLLIDGDPGRMTAYDLGTGARRWQVPFDPRSAPFADACGGALCLRSETGARVLDPATGQLRWADERWMPLFPLGDRLLGVRADEAERLALLDPATGRVTADLGRWRLVGGPSAGPPQLVSRPVAGDRQLLGGLGADGELRLRDLLPERGDMCFARDRTLVCWRPSGELRAWRLSG
ncbi:PQQ-binding-like beta-propeller repeat protein [Micromonospora sp. DT47]|uniref:outer membrane protein assembly factor BamB family protein n=1 Tax=Micromonospora sp. DT47 TaxID=3393431 RepID=UPI003CEEDEA0